MRRARRSTGSLRRAMGRPVFEPRSEILPKYDGDARECGFAERTDDRSGAGRGRRAVSQRSGGEPAHEEADTPREDLLEDPRLSVGEEPLRALLDPELDPRREARPKLFALGRRSRSGQPRAPFETVRSTIRSAAATSGPWSVRVRSDGTRSRFGRSPRAPRECGRGVAETSYRSPGFPSVRSPHPTVKLVTYDELPQSTDPGRALVHMAAFGGFPGRRSVETWRRRSSRITEYVGVFAVDRGEVLGHAYVERFPFAFPHGTETISGIAGVATRLDRARSGVAREILEEIHRRERESGLSYATLWTNRSWGAHRLYEKLGYRDLYAPPFAVRVGAGRRGRPSSVRVRAARLSDVDAIEEAHDRYGARRWGFARRERGTIRLAAVTRELDLKTHVLVAEVDRRVVGYAMVDSSRFRTHCGELVATSAAVRARLIDAVEARAGTGAVAFRDGVVDAMGPFLRRRGYAVAPAGWNGLMGLPYSRTRGRAEVVREFGSGSPKFLCFAGDHF
jgi:GNAT superfamily N-acetyltransferase